MMLSTLVGLCFLVSGVDCLFCECFCSGTPSDDSVSVQMVAAATTEIRKIDAAAKICWAGGCKDDGTNLDAPADTGIWNFLAVSVTGEGTRAWYMTYDGTWMTSELGGQPMGVEFMDLMQVTQDVVEAWGLALAAGYSPPFRSWELFKPINPNVPNPIFVFNMPDGSFVIVDTVTGEVSQERDAWDCYTECREAYIECCDDCRENSPGDPECYDNCDASRRGCDDSCE
jgi:hypothetical protein